MNSLARLMPMTSLWLVSWFLVLAGSLVGCRERHKASGTDSDQAGSRAASPAVDGAAGQGTSLQVGADLEHAIWRQKLQAVEQGRSVTIQVSQKHVLPEQVHELAARKPPVKDLLLDAGRVTDSLAGQLSGLKDLQHLRLRLSPLGDKGLAAALGESGFPELRILNLPQAEITARGLKLLPDKTPNLQQLRLGGSQLDDAAVEAIVGIESLRSLHLIGPSLTDAALETLATHDGLRSFYLDDCPLSDAAWERLFQAKPNLHVHIDQHHHDRDPHADH